VSKITGKPEPGNRGPGSNSDFEKQKTRIPGIGKIIYIHILFYYFILCLVYIKPTYSFLIYTNTKSMSKHRRLWKRLNNLNIITLFSN
jgi:uncharacterized membrane protein YozB (DUF420 family)